MQSRIDAIRAIAAELLHRATRFGALVGGGVYVGIFLLTWFLAFQFSNWWWLLIIPFTVLLFIGAILLAITWIISKNLPPRRLSREECKKILAFSDKVSGLAEAAGTPYPLMLFYIVRDAAVYRENRFIGQVIDDSSSLKTDFEKIQALFE